MQEAEGDVRRRVDTEVVADLVGQVDRRGGGWGIAVAVLAILTLLGIAGAIVRLMGSEGRIAWGYYAATFSFLLSTVMSAPLVIFALRLAKADWRRPMARAVEMMAVGGLVVLVMFLPLPGLLPPLQGRANLWFDWPVGAPGWYDTIAVIALVLTGLALFYVAARPDLAQMRDLQGERARGWLDRLAGDWIGSKYQWRTLLSGIIFLGAFYTMFYVFTTMLVSVDFSMSLVPGWRSAIFPAYHAVTSIEGGLATVVLTLALLRRFGGMERYLGLDQFWSLAKLQLALGLFYFYFWWAEFLTLWYGRTPREQAVLNLLMFGPYLVPFIIAIVCSFLLPFLLLIWNRIRVSILGPTVVSVIVLIGLFFDRVRLYVSAFSVQTITFEPMPLDQIPTHYPDLADVLIVVGALAAVPLLYLLALRLVPAGSLWEIKEGLLLRVTRRFLRTEVTIIGKPR